ncbi:SURF1 family protein, partial [Rugamonas sp.]|uniref:SURF1 family protein n=1 Tax=Rugamonas sp. TaxID=1926287 RepID=UPI0025E34814
WKPQPAPAPAAADACRQAGGPAVTVSGLLRISERAGHLLRQNDPARNFWYSRDLPAIARARGLPAVAPYFVDVDADGETPPPAGDGRPVAGLTVVSFPNSHLVYAVTWYALAAMMAGAVWWVARDGRRRPGQD